MWAARCQSNIPDGHPNREFQLVISLVRYLLRESPAMIARREDREPNSGIRICPEPSAGGETAVSSPVKLHAPMGVLFETGIDLGLPAIGESRKIAT